LLKGSEVGPGFEDSTFTDSHSPSPCGGPDVDEQVPPDIDVGNDASDGTGYFEEEVMVYKTEADAQKSVALTKDAVDCPQPTVEGPEPLQVSGPTDVTSDVSPPVDEAFAYDLKTTEAQGKIVFVRNGNVVASFSFFAQAGTDTSKLPDELTVVNKGVAKLAS